MPRINPWPSLLDDNDSLLRTGMKPTAYNSMLPTPVERAANLQEQRGIEAGHLQRASRVDAAVANEARRSAILNSITPRLGRGEETRWNTPPVGRPLSDVRNIPGGYVPAVDAEGMDVDNQMPLGRPAAFKIPSGLQRGFPSSTRGVYGQPEPSTAPSTAPSMPERMVSGMESPTSERPIQLIRGTQVSYMNPATNRPGGFFRDPTEYETAAGAMSGQGMPAQQTARQIYGSIAPLLQDDRNRVEAMAFAQKLGSEVDSRMRFADYGLRREMAQQEGALRGEGMRELAQAAKPVVKITDAGDVISYNPLDRSVTRVPSDVTARMEYSQALKNMTKGVDIYNYLNSLDPQIQQALLPVLTPDQNEALREYYISKTGGSR